MPRGENLKDYRFEKGDPRAREAAQKSQDVLFEKYLKDKTEPQPLKKLAREEKRKVKAVNKRKRRKRFVLYQANRMLSPQDKEFAKLIAEGSMKKSKAYRQAYDIVLPPQGHPDRKAELARTASLAVQKTKSEKIARAVKEAQNHMDSLFVDSLEVAEEILNHGRSEKVRAELAVEFIRQKQGAPTTKIKNELPDTQVVIVVGERPAPKVGDTNKYFVEGEVVETTADNANIVSDTSDDGLDVIQITTES